MFLNIRWNNTFNFSFTQHSKVQSNLFICIYYEVSDTRSKWVHLGDLFYTSIIRLLIKRIPLQDLHFQGNFSFKTGWGRYYTSSNSKIKEVLRVKNGFQSQLNRTVAALTWDISQLLMGRFLTWEVEYSLHLRALLWNNSQESKQGDSRVEQFLVCKWSTVACAYMAHPLSLQTTVHPSACDIHTEKAPT